MRRPIHNTRSLCQLVIALLALSLFIIPGGCPSSAPAPPDDQSAQDAPNQNTGDSGNNDNDSGGDDHANNNSGGDNNDIVNPPANMRSLTINIQGHGVVTPDESTYAPGTQVALTPVPDAGWRFDRWEGDVTGEQVPLNVTMDENKTITAVFLSFGDAGHELYAVYDRILTTDELGNPFNIKLARMADAASKIFVTNGAGTGDDRKGWVINDLAGISRTEFDLPDGNGQIRFLAVAGNGSRAYMSSGYEDEIYKWELGTVSTIDVSGHPGPGDINRLETTETGDKIFILDDWNIWSLNDDGSGLTMLIDADTITPTFGSGYRVWDMAVNDYGTEVAFLLLAQTPAGYQVELFIWDDGDIRQLTDDRTGYKAWLQLSGDNGRIVYQDQAASQYATVDIYGGNRRNLIASGNNVGGVALDRTGSTMVFNDSGGRGGKRVTTTNGAAIELLPFTISLNMTEQICMSETGTLMFIYRESSSPLKNSIYIGHFTTTMGYHPPGISHTRLSPMSLSRSAPPGADVALEYIISDPDGLDDVVETCADEMVDGVYIGEGANSPASFRDDPRDDGVGIDGTADDGRFTTVGTAGGAVDDYDRVIIRVGARDASGTIVIADVALPIVP